MGHENFATPQMSVVVMIALLVLPGLHLKSRGVIFHGWRPVGVLADCAGLAYRAVGFTSGLEVLVAGGQVD